jgi:hypothetical protein
VKNIILIFFLLSVFYLPAFSLNSGIRLDYVISVLFIPIFFITKSTHGVFKKNLFLFVLFIFLANTLQLIFNKAPLDLIWFSNTIGFTRFLGVYALLSYSRIHIDRHKYFFILFLMLSPVAGILDYFNIEPFNSFLNLFFRADVGNDVPGRALGTFQRVHGLAYFSSFAVILLASYPKLILERKKRVFFLVLNIVALVLTFSRSALLATSISLLFIYRRYFIRYIIYWVLFSLAIIYFAVDSKVFRILDSLFNGFKYLFGLSYDPDQAAFIIARLNWGWGNAIDQFYSSPLFGSLNRGGANFVGDGGYVELLANQGILGICAFLIFIFGLFNSKISALKSLALFFFIANIGSSAWTERIFEILLITIFIIEINERKNIHPLH